MGSAQTLAPVGRVSTGIPEALRPHPAGLQSQAFVGWLTHQACPAVNPSSVLSPAGASQAEEQQYLDKLKQLSKYIEPLRRMINKIDKNEGGPGAGRAHP